MTRARDLSNDEANSGGATPPFVAGKNAVINGGFNIWQRGTSVAVTAGTTAYTVDRYQGLAGASAACTVSRQATSDTTNLPNVQYCARFQRNSGQTGTGDSGLFESIETINSIPFVGKTVTFSFYARAGANYSATSNILISRVYAGTGVDQNVFAFTNLTTLLSLNAVLTTAWQRFTVTGFVPTNVTELAVGNFYQPTGTAGANDYFEVTGLQLEIGSVATPFARAGGSIGGELALCQRYYFRNTPGSNYGIVATGGVTFATTTALFGVQFPVPMRIAPTSAEWGNLQLFDSGNTQYALSAVTVSALNSGTNFSGFEITASGLTVGRPCVLRQNNNAAGYLGFSAEL
jgi:hypothetical protein